MSKQENYKKVMEILKKETMFLFGGLSAEKKGEIVKKLNILKQEHGDRVSECVGEGGQAKEGMQDEMNIHSRCCGELNTLILFLS